MTSHAPANPGDVSLEDSDTQPAADASDRRESKESTSPRSQRDIPMDTDKHQMGGGATSAEGGNVISVYDDQQPLELQDQGQGSAPIATTDAKLFLCVCLLVFLVTLPLLLNKGSMKGIDILALLCLLPALAAFLWARKKQSAVATTATFFQKFVFGWLVLLPAAVIPTLGYTILMFTVGSFSLLFFTLPLFFVAAEEVAKLLFATWKDTHKSVENPKQFVLFSLFTSLGLATAEAYYVSLFLRSLISHWTVLRASAFIQIIVLCCLILIPMHLLSGYHIGLAVARRNVLNQEVSFTLFMLQPILARYGFLCFIFLLPVFLETDWLQVGTLFLVGFYLWWVKRCERGMPRDYLVRTGYLTAFGYGAIPNTDQTFSEPRDMFSSDPV